MIKTVRKFLGIILTIALLPCTNIKATADNVPPLPIYFTDVTAQVGTRAPFKPEHKYGCMQNPPDFTWPSISGAEKYDLIICSDEELTDIKYSKYGLKWHYYNFPNTFELGTYYWAVRYYVNRNSTPSSWSVPRRFRIDPDASEFIVPEDKGEIIEKIPVTHPRIWTTLSDASDLKEIVRQGKWTNVLERMITLCNAYIEQEPLAEPSLTSTAVGTASTKGFQCQLGALCFMLTDDTKYADYAVKTMLELCSWGTSEGKDENGNSIPVSTTSFNGHDQAYYEILLRLSMAYDWMYNYMTDVQRAEVRDILVKRFSVRLQADIDTLRREPYNSHIWSYFGYYGTACMALLYDVDGKYDLNGDKNIDLSDNLSTYLEQMLELYLPSLPPMSFEDGGWSKGTAYWTYAFTRDKWFMDILKVGGYVDCYKKAWAQNETYWALYMMPADSYGSFGDESNFTKPGQSYIMGLSKLGKFVGNDAAYWARNRVGRVENLSSFAFDLLLFSDVIEKNGEKPIDYPNSHVFIDQGMTAMHSSLTKEEKISLYFRSGKYGSYNHMHADQNSFFVEAYGERLAIKSGYYDSYHSTHDSNFTRSTYAHNSITYDGGKGQQDDNMDANGNTEMFVTHHDFDAVTGNAVRAYNYQKNGEQFGLDKYRRSIIYLRPDIYITVDDIKAKEGTQASFEWGFNAPYQTLTVDGSSKAYVKNRKASMDIELVYPQNITNSGLIQDFRDISPERNEFKPGYKYAESSPQDRVYFKTEKTTAAKIAAVMNVHKTNEEAKTVTTEYGSGYIRIKTEDGTTAVINTGANDTPITVGTVNFTGTAVVYNDKSIMLVNGKYLNCSGRMVFSADREITAVCGKGQLSISSDDDMSVMVYPDTAYTQGLERENLKDRKGRSLCGEIGIKSYIGSGGGIGLKAQKGHYMLMTSENSVVNSEQLIPTDLRAIRNGKSNSARAEWTEESGINYDIVINGTEYKNVHSPYEFEVELDKSASIGLIASNSEVKSNMSELIYVYPYGKVSVTETELEYADKNGVKTERAEAGGTVKAKLSCYNGASGDIRLCLAEYNRTGRLVKMISAFSNSGGYGNIETERMETSSGFSYKAFVIDGDGLSPISAVAKGNADASLSGIMIDGKAIDGFYSDVFSYEILLKNGEVPHISGVPSDGTTYTATEYIDAENKAVIHTESAAGEKKEYTVRFSLNDGESIVPLVSDFKQLVGGMTYQQYCDYAGIEPAEGYVSNKKIPNVYKLMTFKNGGDLCGENHQRKLTSINREYGIENCYFIGSGASLLQTGSSAPWIVSAYTGAKVVESVGTNEYTHDTGAVSVPWFSFKVNRDCNVIVLSDTKPKFCVEDSSWVFQKLSLAPYTALRNEKRDKLSTVTPFYNMYLRSYSAGDTVTLCNDASGISNAAGMPYLTIIKFD